jgi:hypothetical protein
VLATRCLLEKLKQWLLVPAFEAQVVATMCLLEKLRCWLQGCLQEKLEWGLCKKSAREAQVMAIRVCARESQVMVTSCLPEKLKRWLQECVQENIK